MNLFQYLSEREHKVPTLLGLKINIFV